MKELEKMVDASGVICLSNFFRKRLLEHSRSSILFVVLVCFATGVSGCSSGSVPNYTDLGLVQVSGIITIDGAPLANTKVRFVTPEDATFSHGVTDASGRYALMFDSETAGVIPGRKRVVFLSGNRSGDESSDGDNDQSTPSTGSQIASVAIPECYGNNSKIEVEVTQSDSSFNIDLKSDCSTVSR
jgi:hypothetical protein